MKNVVYLCSNKANDLYQNKMATQIIKTNDELKTLIDNMNVNTPLFAIRTKGQIEVFNTKRSFNKTAKALPNAVQGELNPYNYIWYRF